MRVEVRDSTNERTQKREQETKMKRREDEKENLSHQRSDIDLADTLDFL